MKQNFLFFAAFLLSASAFGQFAQKQTNAKKTITLTQAIELAHSNSLVARLGALSIAEQESQKRQALALYLPKLELGATQRLNWPSTSIAIGEISSEPIVIQPAWQFDGQLTLIQPVLNMKALWLMDTSTLELKRRRHQLDATHEELSEKVISAYFESIKAENTLQIAEEWKSRAKALLDWVESRERHNFLTTLDVDKAKIEFERATRNLMTAQTARELSLGTLGVLIGIREDFFIVPQTHLPALEQGVSDETHIANSTQNSKELLAEMAALNVAQRNFENSYASFYPTISFVGQGAFTTTPSGLSPAALKGTFLLQATWNLYDGGERYAEIKTKRTQIQMQMARIEDIKEKIDARLRGQLVQIKNKVNTLETQKKMAQLQKSVYLASKRSFENGLLMTNELINASHDLKNFELEAETTSYELAKLRYELALALGQLNDLLSYN